MGEYNNSQILMYFTIASIYHMFEHSLIAILYKNRPPSGRN